MIFLNIPITMRKLNNKIIIDYDNNFDKNVKNVLESNIVYECFQNVANKYEFESYYAFLGTQYKRKFEILSEEAYKKIEENFFIEMNKNIEKVLGFVLEVMDTPLKNYLTYSNIESFNILKYFVEFGEIPSINDFYALKMTEYYAGIKEYKFQNIQRSIRYTIYDYTNGMFKRHQNMKCKYVVKIDENGKYNKIIKRCKTYDEAFNLIKSKVNFVKGV